MSRILILISIIFIVGCEKEDISKRPLGQTDIWSCYNSSAWTNLTIRKELIGSWKWIYTENYWAPDKGWNTENEKTQIEFLNDSTLNVTIDGELMSTTKWTVIRKDGELMGVIIILKRLNKTKPASSSYKLKEFIRNV